MQCHELDKAFSPYFGVTQLKPAAYVDGWGFPKSAEARTRAGARAVDMEQLSQLRVRRRGHREAESVAASLDESAGRGLKDLAAESIDSPPFRKKRERMCHPRSVFPRFLDRSSYSRRTQKISTAEATVIPNTQHCQNSE